MRATWGVGPLAVTPSDHHKVYDSRDDGPASRDGLYQCHPGASAVTSLIYKYL